MGRKRKKNSSNGKRKEKKPKIPSYFTKGLFKVTTIAGKPNESGFIDGIGEDARFDTPKGICIENGGNSLLVADRNNHSIRRISLDGRVSTILHQIDGKRVLNYPYSVTQDSKGNTFIADTHGHVIRCLSLDGSISIVAGKEGERGDKDGDRNTARLRVPSGLVVSGDGTIFTTDCSYDKEGDTEELVIRRISTSGYVDTIYTTQGDSVELSMDRDGSLVVLKERSIIKMNRDGEIIEQMTPKDDTMFVSLRCGSFHPSGDFIFADKEGRTIWRLTMNGEMEIIAGKNGVKGHKDGDSMDSQFSYPYGIACDGDGNIYVSDWGSHCIRKITQIRWTIDTHKRFPESSRSMVKILMTLWRMRESTLHVIHRDVLFFIFDLLIF